MVLHPVKWKRIQNIINNSKNNLRRELAELISSQNICWTNKQSSVLTAQSHNPQLTVTVNRKMFSYMWLMDQGIMTYSFQPHYNEKKLSQSEKIGLTENVFLVQWYLSQVAVSFSVFMKSSRHLGFRHECEENGSFETEIMRWDNSEHLSVIVDQLVISFSFFYLLFFTSRLSPVCWNQDHTRKAVDISEILNAIYIYSNNIWWLTIVWKIYMYIDEVDKMTKVSLKTSLTRSCLSGRCCERRSLSPAQASREISQPPAPRDLARD